jgi:hypothetical protein
VTYLFSALLTRVLAAAAMHNLKTVFRFKPCFFVENDLLLRKYDVARAIVPLVLVD